MADTNDFLSMQAPAAKPAGFDLASLTSMAAPLAAKGEDLLKSGQVSLKDAQAAQKQLGLDPATVQDAFQKAVSGGAAPQAQPSDAFNSVLLGKTGAQAPAKTTGTKNDKKTDQETSNKQTRNIQATAAQAGDAMDVFRNTPEAQSQREGISKMENLLAMNQAHQRPNDAWIKSLLAYGDSLNGTNQAASFEPQAAKQNDSMLKFANEIQQRKGDYAKSIEDAIAKTKVGTDQNSMVQKLMEQAAITSGNGGNSRGSAYLKAIPIRAGGDFDKQLKDTTNSVEALNRGDSFLNDTRMPLTYQAFNQAQQDITKGLVGSGAPTDAKTAMDMQQLFQGAMQTLKTKYTGKFDPAKDDLRKAAPEVVAQVNKGLQKIRSDMNDRVNRDTDQIRQNYESSFDEVPGLRETVEKKIAQIQKRHPRSADYNETGIFKMPGTEVAAAAGGKTPAGDVTDDVNADLTKLTHEQRLTWMKKHGG